MAAADESTCNRDSKDRHGGFVNQCVGTIKADSHILYVDGRVEMTREQPFELAPLLELLAKRGTLPQLTGCSVDELRLPKEALP